MSSSTFIKPDENGNWGKIGSFQEMPSGQTLQNAATGTGNGTVLDCLGYSSINLTMSNGSGAQIYYEGSLDGTTFFIVYDNTGVFYTSVIYSTRAVAIPVSGFRYFRARISAYYGGTVTAVAYLSSEPPQTKQRIIGLTGEGYSFSNDFDYWYGSATFPYIYNGFSYDRFRSNVPTSTLLSSTLRTSTTASSDVTNYNHRGAYIFLNVTFASGTGGLQVRVMAKNTSASVYSQINTLPTAITSTGQYVVQVYPSVNSTNSNILQTVSQTLPRTFRVDVVHSDASSYTYSLAIDFIV